MSLSEFWAFCKDVNAPTIHLNLTRATLLFTQIDTKYKDDPYNPRRGFNLHEFMEGIVRLSVLRQGNPANPKVGLPDCLEDFLLNHVLRDNENFRDSQQVRQALVLPWLSHCEKSSSLHLWHRAMSSLNLDPITTHARCNSHLSRACLAQRA
eukprot:scaffold29953_cov31-Tisochrysis_lutea.AAC.3